MFENSMFDYNVGICLGRRGSGVQIAPPPTNGINVLTVPKSITAKRRLTNPISRLEFLRPSGTTDPSRVFRRASLSTEATSRDSRSILVLVWVVS